ncbi:motility associated factor glycosyltransferase family protein [Niveibacterium sp.]|uniref:motility associated factor glycosyltransferase family protein n=1 Tax=Niveibacterium sp. TaxID=2017444 RepID=UPI0035AF95E8
MTQDQSAAVGENWTPLQEAYIQKLYATYQANLYFLHTNFPAVFDRLMATQLPAPFEVDADANVRIYSGRFVGTLREFTDLGRTLFEVFESEQGRSRVWVEASYLDDVGQITQHGLNPDFFRPIEPSFRAELVEEFQRVCPGSGERFERPYFGHRVQPLVVVFGSGFGWHLDRLVDTYEIQNLVIVDTEVERLNLSLYFVDYVALYQRFASRGRSFSIALHPHISILSASVLAAIQRHAPPYVVQGAALFFHDYDSEPVRELWERIRTDLGNLFRGWGFFDDELLGLKHAVENSLARRPVFVGGGVVPDDAVAIVVGAGPSLDGLLPVLRECRDRVVIFSCGTALSALANAGIKPDFHIEIERTAATFRVLDTPTTRAVLADTPLIASAIMCPAVFDLTPQPGIFLKEIDFGSNMLDFDSRLPRIRTNPTCTNGGLHFVLKMGFREVYLFGVDLGFHPEGVHHSRHSIYYQDNGAAKEGYLAGMVAGTHWLHRSGTPIPANFDGVVLSTEQLTYSRDVMQRSIADFPDARVFNPNDGAQIAGAHTVRPDALQIGSSPAAREAARQAISQSFMRGVLDDMGSNLQSLLVQLDAVVADLTALFEPPVTRRAELFERLADMHAYFFHPQHQESQIFPLMRGSMQHMGRFAWDCFALTRNDAQAIAFSRVVFDLFLRFLRAGRENIESLHALATTGTLPEPRKD